MNGPRTKHVQAWLWGGVLALIVAFELFPVFWMLRASLLPIGEAFPVPPRMLFVPVMSNYVHVLMETKFPTYFLNSLLVAGSSTALALLLGVPAAYALARFRFRGRDQILFYILSTRMGLPIMVLLAFFVQFSNLGLLDTRFALTVTYLTFNLPLCIWFLTGFFEGIPSDMEEAALIDGCSRNQALRHVVLPVAAPGLAATAILMLLFSMNEFLFATVLTGENARTATVAVYSFLGRERLDWEYMTATALMVTLPVLILALSVQRYLVAGLTFGSVKD